MKSLKGGVDEGTATGIAKATWVVYSSDLDAAGEPNPDDFYFLVKSKDEVEHQSGDLKINVTDIPEIFNIRKNVRLIIWALVFMTSQAFLKFTDMLLHLP